MKGAGTNRSFAAVHRDVEREQDLGGVLVVLINGGSCICSGGLLGNNAKIRKLDIGLIFNSYLSYLWSLLEDVSNGASGAPLTARIAPGLLHGFIF